MRHVVPIIVKKAATAVKHVVLVIKKAAPVIKKNVPILKRNALEYYDAKNLTPITIEVASGEYGNLPPYWRK